MADTRNNEMLREVTRRTLGRLRDGEIVTPERYGELFAEEESRLLEEGGELLRKELAEVHREVEEIRGDLYRDGTTLCRNRLWLYRRKLDDHQCFRDSGVMGGLRLGNYGSLREEYGETAVERVARIFADSVREYFPTRGISCEAVRYLDRECLLFFDGEDAERTGEEILEFARRIEAAPVRYLNRRLGIAVDAAVTEYAAGEPFHLAMDRIEEQLFRQGRGA